MKGARRFRVWAALALAGCNGGNSDPGGGATTWDATVAGKAEPLAVSSQAASTQADGGLRFDAAGTRSGGTFAFSVDFAGSLNVDLPPPTGESAPAFHVPVGGGHLNVSLGLDGVRYRGTSGAVTLTAYGVNAGETVKGSFDIGLVKVGGLSGDAATLKGAFETIVEAGD